MPNYCSNTIIHTSNKILKWNKLNKKLKKWKGINFKKYITPEKLGLPKDTDWYEFNCKYWGTKWNASGTYVNVIENKLEKSYETIINFDTAWSPPSENLVIFLLNDLANILGLDVEELRMEYSECGCELEGEFYINNSELYHEEIEDINRSALNTIELEDYPEIDESNIRITLQNRALIGYYGYFNKEDRDLIELSSKSGKAFYISKKDIKIYHTSKGYHYIKFRNDIELIINSEGKNAHFEYEILNPYKYTKSKENAKYITYATVSKELSLLYKRYQELSNFKGDLKC